MSQRRINTMASRSSTDVGESPPNSAYVPDVEKAQAAANASAESRLKEASADIVDWDGPNDPENPQNW